MKYKDWITPKHKRFIYALLIAVFTLFNWIATCRLLTDIIPWNFVDVLIVLAVLVLYQRLAIGVGYLLDKHGF